MAGAGPAREDVCARDRTSDPTPPFAHPILYHPAPDGSRDFTEGASPEEITRERAAYPVMRASLTGDGRG